MRYLKFYANDKTGKRRIFTFKVNNEQDAIKALTRFNQKSGYYQNDAGKSFKISARNNPLNVKHSDIFKKWKI